LEIFALFAGDYQKQQLFGILGGDGVPYPVA
jgi:hypothetical protein